MSKKVNFKYPTVGYKTEEGDIVVKGSNNVFYLEQKVMWQDLQVLDTFWRRLRWLFTGKL